MNQSTKCAIRFFWGKLLLILTEEKNSWYNTRAQTNKAKIYLKDKMEVFRTDWAL
jgi:hypothetical protein